MPSGGELETLSRHDFFIETEGNLRFTVELFRRWVESQESGE
ncbi:hypothetical protein [Okeania sp. SIO2C2]|nr:hypothetical protein [Okeania sp. SIO2C2]